MKICFEGCEIDWELVNYILLPPITFSSVIIYYLALRNSQILNENSQKQNEILLSQNIKPNFEREVYELEKEGRNLFILKETPSQPTIKNDENNYHALIIYEYILLILIEIGNNEDYLEDLNKKEITPLKPIDLRRRSYYPDVIFLISEILHWWRPLGEYYSRTFALWKQIEKSKMIDEDKFLILNIFDRKITSIILSSYERFSNSGLQDLMIPMEKIEDQVEWYKLSNFEVIDLTEKLKLHLRKRKKIIDIS